MEKSLESRIAALESRNIRVELDKKWETSATRKIAILVLTYLIIGGYIAFLGNEKWYLHALVPVCGFYLSTLALPIVRKIWEKKV